MCARPTLTTASLSPDRLLATTGSWQARACVSIRRYPIVELVPGGDLQCRTLFLVEMLPMDRDRRRGRSQSGHGTSLFRNFSHIPA